MRRAITTSAAENRREQQTEKPWVDLDAWAKAIERVVSA